MGTHTLQHPPLSTLVSYTRGSSFPPPPPPPTSTPHPPPAPPPQNINARRKRKKKRYIKGTCIASKTKIRNTYDWKTTAQQKKEEVILLVISFFIVFLTVLTVVELSFCSLTNGITPKICRLCVCVIINKCSFEPFMCLDPFKRSFIQQVKVSFWILMSYTPQRGPPQKEKIEVKASNQVPNT